MLRRIFSSAASRIVLSAFLIFAVFYVMLPAINLKDRTFITFLIICIGIVLVVNFFSYVLAFLSSIGDKSVSFKDGVERLSLIHISPTARWAATVTWRKACRWEPWTSPSSQGF